ncbi:MAG: cell division protein ZipA C-terminal FtsZ-binding domain-containing protein [Gammaproteobacteria bacterium]|nr:cell division protein ZipA C-terminal FtsZ-binding domain-containing protein [Gammaproteobacteria bacterium]MDH3371114.1 cell division protein ZipA C-terminal FtsZ-binding domain-containing protein [Gammaproteobacteria bacterium]MDH3406311.1 cell division protein ZipA C-terminal FtsZ-binding domain-containing protein [Gammaproteobacteria bacterium]MDH3562842.1 cell division protein ZipA C-terminal FtsZ-binding domain-containing protein [Gammaproteobacteria bacterium]MDH5486105.1 cell divisio
MNLQYALIFIGIVIIAVVALSAYDMSRLRRPRPRPKVHLGTFPEDDTPVRSSLLNASRDEGSEKVLRSDIEIAPREPEREDILLRELRQMEEVATMPLDLTAGLRRPGRFEATPGRQYLSDEKIDFVIHLPGDQPVARDSALGIYKQHEYKLNKARHLYGLHHGTSHWSDLQLDRSSTKYDDLMLAIQLVDPKGPVDESELTVFTEIGLQLADALQRPTKLPLTFEQGLARAAELQSFCDTYDVIAGIHVVPDKEPVFPGRAIEMAARHVGLELGGMNLFHLKNEVAPGSRHLFSLANIDDSVGFDPDSWDTFQTGGLTLFMSVPCAFQPAVVFKRMVTTAKEMAETLGGKLQDQNRRPLTDKGITVIHQQIEEIEEKMRVFGIPAGSETALKLFKEATIL